MGKKAASKKQIAATCVRDSVDDINKRYSDLEKHLTRVNAQLDELQVLTAKLLEVGVAISSEIDLFALLSRIIDESKRLLRADRGTLYLVDPDNNELFFHVTDAAKIKETRLLINDKSIAGYVALTRETLNIPDVYKIDKKQPYSFNKEFDKRGGYRTRSMLTVPMVNHEGRITGAVQIINKMRDEAVEPFNARDQRILLALASQAAVAIENAQLYKEVADLFDSFVRYSASAIDERDPATAGHSRRVALYATAIARALGGFSEPEIKELEYAAWLHDVGKIGVREHILIKENKLYPFQMGMVRERFKAVKLSIRNQFLNKKADMLSHGAAGSKLQELEQKMLDELSGADEDLMFLERINRPGFVTDDDLQRLDKIAHRRFIDAEGRRQPFITADEKKALRVRKGNLTDEEREIMNAHVESTFKILSQIPFTAALKRVPLIAATHHEKLDGSGYPRRLKEPSITMQSRILALADIYDALTAQDRPYKPAMPTEKAMKILEFEVKDGHLDPRVFKVFKDNEIYNLKDPGETAINKFKSD